MWETVGRKGQILARREAIDSVHLPVAYRSSPIKGIAAAAVKLFAWFLNLIAVGKSYVLNSLLFLLNGQYLQFVDKLKYLGHIVHHDSTDG